jgi:two-component system, LytTR family, sensor kinase
MSRPFGRHPKLVVAALCLAFGVIEGAQGYAGAVWREDPAPISSALIFSFLPWIPVAALAPIIATFGERWPLDHGRWRAHLSRHVVAMFAFTLVHEMLAALLTSPWMNVPIGWPLFLKQLTFRSALDAMVYWAIIGATHAVRASREAREREQATIKLEAGLAEARLTALRAQLDPHFLFNTLNAVSALALRGEREGVVKALSTLSDLLRATLGGAPTQEVALADELALLDRYVEIQRLRFSDRLQVVRHIEGDVLDAAVPAMLLQPLVENAIKHGISVRPEGMRIEIHARRSGAEVTLEVRDTGPGFGNRERASPNGDAGGIGLANTRERLVQLYGTTQRLECRDAEGKGAVVQITLPYRQIPIGPPRPARPAALPAPVP